MLQAGNSNKSYEAGIFYDLAEAFNCVKHSVLMNKLSYIGINVSASKWLTLCDKQAENSYDKIIKYSREYSF
jgi:hypothetical protein